MKHATNLLVATLMAASLHAQPSSTAAAGRNISQKALHAHASHAVEYDARDETGAELLREYAAGVNSRLRELGAAVRTISDQEQAGELTADDARLLKLAATRAMLARLETLTAVYDSVAAEASDERQRSTGNGSSGDDDDDDDSAGPDLLRASRTVSVGDLARHAARISGR